MRILLMYSIDGCTEDEAMQKRKEMIDIYQERNIHAHENNEFIDLLSIAKGNIDLYDLLHDEKTDSFMILSDDEMIPMIAALINSLVAVNEVFFCKDWFYGAIGQILFNICREFDIRCCGITSVDRICYFN